MILLFNSIDYITCLLKIDPPKITKFRLLAGSKLKSTIHLDLKTTTKIIA